DTYTSETFDQQLMSINTWDDAVAAGFITGGVVNNFNAISTTAPWDPYSYLNSALQTKVNNYLTIGSTSYSMMEVSAMMSRCQNELIGVVSPAPSCSDFGSDISLDPIEN